MKMKRLEKPPKPSAAARTVPIERKSSIETEPRTLSFNQIQSARDAALCVINTKSLEEAFTIFTKGLQPLSVSANAAMRKKGISSTMNSNSVEKNKKSLVRHPAVTVVMQLITKYNLFHFPAILRTILFGM